MYKKVQSQKIGAAATGSFRSFLFLTTVLIVLISLLPSISPAETCRYGFLEEINRQKYPFAHAVLAREIEHIEYHADGSKESQDDVYITVLDEEGKQNHKVLSFSVNKAYGQLNIELCEIIRDGRSSKIDIAAQSHEEAAAGNSRSNIYNPLQKVIKLFLPGLEIGDTIHYRLKSRQFKPIIENQIYGSILGQYDIPIRSYIFTLTTPTAGKLNWLIKDEVEGKVTYRKTVLPGKAAKTIRSWHFQNVPQIVPEPMMPSFRRVAMRLLYSTLPDWQTIASWYDELVTKKLTPKTLLKEMVDKLVADKSDQNEKMAALFYYVAREIRYLGVSGESERPGFEPHDVNLTFSRRHGVCRDKAALLVAMLQYAGFNAKAVLIRVGDKLDYEIPLPYFNHAIVAVLDNQDNVTDFLDPTSETSRQFLPDYERECSYLVADQQKSDLGLTPPVSPEKNNFKLKIVEQISAVGNSQGTLTVNCTGFNDTLMRSIMMNMSKKEQEHFLERFFLNQYSTLELSNIKWSDPADRSRNFNFSGDFTVNTVTTVSEKENPITYLQPLLFIANPSLLERWIINQANMTKRHYPIKLGYTFSTVAEEHLTFTQPPQKIYLPKLQNQENEVFTATLSCRQTAPGQLLIKRRFAMKKTEVGTDLYHLLTSLQNFKRNLSLTPIVIENKN
ncbi:MAG: hypothetical protein DRH03_02910 [Deltaproteobacteria bacterium]|nr:MAG: hypothetical protein DRH03_02910 [Deltaproteobacteria bacterium]